MAKNVHVRYAEFLPRRRISPMVLVLGIGIAVGGIAFGAMLMRFGMPSWPQFGASDPALEKPYYVKLPKLMANVRGTAPNVLHTSVTLKFAAPKGREAMKANLPAVRHLVLMTAAAETTESLSTPEGRVQLGALLTTKINEFLDLDEETGIEEVLFDEFMLLP